MSTGLLLAGQIIGGFLAGAFSMSAVFVGDLEKSTQWFYVSVILITFAFTILASELLGSESEKKNLVKHVDMTKIPVEGIARMVIKVRVEYRRGKLRKTEPEKELASDICVEKEEK